MTLILELDPELRATYKTEAERRGVYPGVVALEVLRTHHQRRNPPTRRAIVAMHIGAALVPVFGKGGLGQKGADERVLLALMPARCYSRGNFRAQFR